MMNRVEMNEETMAQVNGGDLETNLPNSKSKISLDLKKGIKHIGHLEADEENHTLTAVRD